MKPEAATWTGGSINQGMLRIACIDEKLRKRHGTYSLYELPEGTKLSNMLISDIWAPQV